MHTPPSLFGVSALMYDWLDRSASQAWVRFVGESHDVKISTTKTWLAKRGTAWHLLLDLPTLESVLEAEGAADSEHGEEEEAGEEGEEDGEEEESKVDSSSEAAAGSEDDEDDEEGDSVDVDLDEDAA